MHVIGRFEPTCEPGTALISRVMLYYVRHREPNVKTIPSPLSAHFRNITCQMAVLNANF